MRCFCPACGINRNILVIQLSTSQSQIRSMSHKNMSDLFVGTNPNIFSVTELLKVAYVMMRHIRIFQSIGPWTESHMKSSTTNFSFSGLGEVLFHWQRIHRRHSQNERSPFEDHNLTHLCSVREYEFQTNDNFLHMW